MLTSCSIIIIIVIVLTSVLRQLNIGDMLIVNDCRLAAAVAIARRGAYLTLGLDVAPTDVITRKLTAVSGRLGGVASESRHGKSRRRRVVLVTWRPRLTVAIDDLRCSRTTVIERRRQCQGHVTTSSRWRHTSAAFCEARIYNNHITW